MIRLLMTNGSQYMSFNLTTQMWLAAIRSSGRHWVLRLSLAAHPQLQAKLAQELDEAGLLASPSRPEPRPLTHADLTALPYMDAVIKESMRLWPVASTGTGRVATEDTALGGYHIPAGSFSCIMHTEAYQLSSSQIILPCACHMRGEQCGRSQQQCQLRVHIWPPG